jgi:tRNA-dihydrouridine synthase 3
MDASALTACVCTARGRFLKPISAILARTDRDAPADAGDEGKKRGGTFKKRPADAAEDPADHLCRPVAIGGECAFGDSCKFSHDVAEYMKRKPKDLGVRCPVFDALGYCNDGLSCRFAMAHVEKLDGLFHNVGQAPPSTTKDETNTLTHDVRLALRKNKYPFLSKEQRRSKNHGRNHSKHNKHDQAAPAADAEAAVTEAAAVKEPADPVAALLSERKPVDFKRKIYVAPLTTVGNLPFRRLLKKTGADITCGEMALSSNLLRAQQSEWALLRRHASEDVFGVQIAGAHGDQMARVCELLARETDVDFIDINMGCPIDLVCSAGAGAALMNRPPRMLEVISGALTGIELGTSRAEFRTGQAPGLSVKLRTGWSEKTPVAHKLMSKIQTARGSTAYMNAGVVTPDFTLRAQQGVDAIMIHGRSRLQRYTRNADWDYIFQCADATSEAMDDAMNRPQFVGGGDVLSFEEFDAHLKNGKLETCMLARGALIKPWLPTEIKERRHYDISASERLDLLKEFVNFGLEHWGSDQKGVNRTRRYLLEWQSFLCRYIPVGLLEVLPQQINERPAPFYGRNDLESLMASDQAVDWIKISEMLLGPVPDGFEFVPKHKANAYVTA